MVTLPGLAHVENKASTGGMGRDRDRRRRDGGRRCKHEKGGEELDLGTKGRGESSIYMINENNKSGLGVGRQRECCNSTRYSSAS